MKPIFAVAVAFLISSMVVGCASNGKEASRQVAASADPSSATIPHTYDVPPTDPLARNIRDQVARNWNLGGLAGSPDLAGMVVQLRLELLPDGTVAKVEVENDQPGNSTFRQIAESAMRAVKLSSPLKLPPGSRFNVIHLRFHPDESFS